MTTAESRDDSAAAAIRRINQAWLAGRVDDLAPLVHPDVVMVFPGFVGQVAGREGFLEGFREFCANARIHEFHERDHQISVTGEVAVVTFRYDMVYELSGQRSRASGRDLWVLAKQAGRWLAVWRTMLDVEEHPP